MAKNKIIYIALGFIIIEIVLTTFLNNIFGHYLSPIVYLFAGIGLGLLLIHKGYEISAFANVDTSTTPKSKKYWILGSVVGLLLVSLQTIFTFRKHPILQHQIDKTGSDVIPQIMYFVQRFLNGEFPYKPIPVPELNYTLTPTYLPFQWLPYIPAEIFGFDFRYIALFICLLAIVLVGYQILKITNRSYQTALLCFVPFVYLAIYFRNTYTGSAVTVEYNVSAYYLFLGIALYKKNTWGIALSLLICILSRYSLVIWLPLLGVLGWYCLGKKAFWKIITIILAGIVVFYVPFFFKDPQLFIKGFEYYAHASIGEWSLHDWQGTDARYPHHLNHGIGFANYAYDFFPGDLNTKISAYQKLHSILCIIVTIILSIYWWKNRKKYSFEVFTIASLKIYLTIFYSFVVIPYPYLYILPNLFSFIVLLTILRTIKTPPFIKNI